MNRTALAVIALVALGAVLASAAQDGVDAGAAWTASSDPEAPLPTGAQARHFRVLAEVRPDGMEGVRDLPVQMVLPVAKTLSSSGGFPSRSDAGGAVELLGFALDPDSFTVREVDASGKPLGEQDLPVLVTPGSVLDNERFHPERNPTVTLRWVMPGATTGPRTFYIYFESQQNGDPALPSVREGDRTLLASSVGPGRGTRLHIPLYPLAGAQGPDEPRHVRVTALHDETSVAFHEYRGGVPRPAPIDRMEDMARGQTFLYTLGANGNEPSEGSVLVVADRPVVAEAVSSRDPTATTNAFLPSADGGYVGGSFLATPAADQQWHVFCPAHLAVDLAPGQTGCRVSLGGVQQDLGPNGRHTYNVAGGQATSLDVAQVGERSLGAVVVQRGGPGITYWPPLDGPNTASRFLGHAGATDQLLVTSAHDDACLLVVSQGSGDILADKGNNRLCPFLDGPVFHDSRSWGTSFDRTWEVDSARHEDGAVRIEEHRSRGAISVASGAIGDVHQFGALVVPQSPDGGLHYTLYIPESTDGVPLGRVVLFALYGGTSGTAIRDDGTIVEIPALRAGERFDIQGAGRWSIEADSPLVAAWLKNGIGSFSGVAPGFTDAAAVDAVAAQYAGYVLDVDVVGSPFQQRQPGDIVRFDLDVTNHAQDTGGHGLPDGVTVSVDAPDDWGAVNVIPPRRDLQPGESARFEVQATVPSDVDADAGGATLLAGVRSVSNPDLTVVQPLQVSYVIRRGVQILEAETGEQTEVRRQIAAGETTTYVVRVRNVGSAPDAFDLQFSTPPGRWVQDVIAPTGDPSRTPVLASGESVDYFVDVASTDDGPAAKLTTRVRAASVADRSVTDGLRLVTIVGVERSFRIEVDEPTRTVRPGGVTTFLLRVHNEADVNEELGVKIIPSAPAGWPGPTVRWVDEDASIEEVNHTIRMGARQTATLAVTQEVPLDAAPLDLALDRIRLESRFDPETPASDTGLRVIADRVLGFEASSTTPAQRTHPGGPATIRIDLDSLGNVPQDVVVTPHDSVRGWGALDEEGGTAPWNVTLSPHGNATLSLTLDVPSHAGPGDVPVTFFLTAAGAATQNVTAVLDVAPLRSVEVLPGSTHLDPGHTVTLDVPVHNTGNVPLALSGAWAGLPEWNTVTQNLTLEPGDHGVLRTAIEVPAGASAGPIPDATLLVTADGQEVVRAPWNLTVGGPVLEISLERSRPVDGQHSAYTVQVSNTGDQSAHNVSVLLDDRSTGTVDRFAFHQILPGTTSTAVLLGPLDADRVTIRVVADHDPTGTELSLHDGRGESDRRLAPAPLVVPALVVCAVASRRWWQ